MKSPSLHNISIDNRSQYAPDKRMHPQDLVEMYWSANSLARCC